MTPTSIHGHEGRTMHAGHLDANHIATSSCDDDATDDSSKISGSATADTYVSQDWSERVRAAWRGCRNSVEGWTQVVQASLNRRREKAILAEMLTFAVERLAPPEAIRGWYTANGDVQTLRRAIDQVQPHSLYGMNAVLKKICRTNSVTASMVRDIRCWLDAILGPQDSLADARSGCKRLFLHQHEDKVGKRDFGSPLYQRHADEFWDLLKTTRTLLAHPQIAPMLYGPEPIVARAKKTLAVFLGVVVGLVGVHCWQQSFRSGNPLLTDYQSID